MYIFLTERSWVLKLSQYFCNVKSYMQKKLQMCDTIFNKNNKPFSSDLFHHYKHVKQWWNKHNTTSLDVYFSSYNTILKVINIFLSKTKVYPLSPLPPPPRHIIRGHLCSFTVTGTPISGFNVHWTLHKTRPVRVLSGNLPETTAKKLALKLETLSTSAFK